MAALGKTRPYVKIAVPETMIQWSNVRIAGGDRIRTGMAQANKQNIRDASFVRVCSIYLAHPPNSRFVFSKLSPLTFLMILQYEVQEDEHRNNRKIEENPIRKTCYGRLEYIIECWTRAVGSTMQARRHLLAVITRCKTPDNSDATQQLVTYTDIDSGSHIIDLASVGAVVGRIHIGGTQPRWGIIDRSLELAHAIFVDEEENMADLYDSL